MTQKYMVMLSWVVLIGVVAGFVGVLGFTKSGRGFSIWFFGGGPFWIILGLACIFRAAIWAIETISQDRNRNNE